ncbi:hypothetical protein RHA1_ro04997 [Rhodococcus jostii RHA1]|uniref:Uncharacterized protein n=1 Tax=Rhodococcus jostii (strain RHA1) TaxID=101510 RepID=Q0S6Q8_RHOJR|nr:hypothetical protein RHA1_ro04997 [Rhodococcus jostii RHA1]
MSPSVLPSPLRAPRCAFSTVFGICAGNAASPVSGNWPSPIPLPRRAGKSDTRRSRSATLPGGRRASRGGPGSRALSGPAFGTQARVGLVST